jgi:nitrogenase-associated protein
MNIRFFEKPNCKGNARQKEILQEAGHTLTIENLLTYPLTREMLRAFFGTAPQAEWFNLTAPAIKSGEIDPAALNEDETLDAMLTDRLLIRRPLMEFGTHKVSGFSLARLETLGLACDPGQKGHLEGQDLVTCPCQKKDQ